MFTKLEKDQYSIVKKLVDSAGYESVFAYSVIENNLPGQIHVDDIIDPKSALICSDHGKYLIAGDETNPNFNSSLNKFLSDKNNHIKFYDLYASSEKWIKVLSSSLNGQVVPLTFHIYYHDKNNKELNIENNISLEHGLEVKQIDETIFEKIANEFDHSYKYHWTSSHEFCLKSFGFCVMKGDEVLSVAASTYTGNGYAEIDIQTRNDYYRKGLAYKLCSKFIEYCEKNKLTTLWVCDSGNEPSKSLVKKLGFKKSKDVDMLWWHENQEIIASYLSKYNYQP